MVSSPLRHAGAVARARGWSKIPASGQCRLRQTARGRRRGSRRVGTCRPRVVAQEVSCSMPRLDSVFHSGGHKAMAKRPELSPTARCLGGATVAVIRYNWTARNDENRSSKASEGWQPGLPWRPALARSSRNPARGRRSVGGVSRSRGCSAGGDRPPRARLLECADRRTRASSPHVVHSNREQFARASDAGAARRRSAE